MNTVRDKTIKGIHFKLYNVELVCLCAVIYFVIIITIRSNTYKKLPVDTSTFITMLLARTIKRT